MDPAVTGCVMTQQYCRRLYKYNYSVGLTATFLPQGSAALYETEASKFTQIKLNKKTSLIII